MNKKILCITGPTAIGKSSLAMNFCRKKTGKNGHIISMDAAQIYRGIDIASAKPSKTELDEVPHHLINICSPDEYYSAAKFLSDVKRLLIEIEELKGVPIITGGTMMYLHRLTQGINSVPEIPKVEVKKVEEMGREDGWEKLHSELMKIDPFQASKIGKRDSQRITRQLSVWKYTGRTLRSWQNEKNAEKPIPFLKIIALVPSDQDYLHQRIKKRLKAMINNGLMDEAKSLKNSYKIARNSPSSKLVGIRQALAFLDKEISYSEFVYRTEVATKQLAKRQLTWLNKFKDVTFVDPVKTTLNQQISICASDSFLGTTSPR